MLTLRSLLADPALELRLLVPGPEGAVDAEIVWVHTTELADPSYYVRERELVLTNGIWLDAAEPAGFVAGVRRAGAAGIVFGLRAEQTSTPEALIAACRDADVPLVEISVEVPFTAISRAAAASYAAQRQEALLGLVRRGNALAAAISHGAGASGVLAVLRGDHDLPLAVVDRVGRVLAAVGAELDAAQAAAAADALGRRPRPLEVDLDGAGRATMYPVGAVGDADAALLCLRPVRGLNAVERDALDQAARFLSLEVARQQAVQAIEQRFASELLDMVLSGAHRAAEVPGRLRAFGVDPDGPLAVCAVAFRGGDPEPATLPGLVEAITDFFPSQSLSAVVAGGTQDVVAVLAWRRPPEEVSALASQLVAALGPRFPGREPVIGIGGTASSAAELRQPLEEAREAARVLRARRGGGASVTTFAELGGYRHLLALHDPGQRQRFADSVLGPLRDHDRRRGGELVTTLRAFLDRDGHWAATAAALYVHVNTLRNRIARIAELTGRDVTRTADRVDLFLALEAER